MTDVKSLLKSLKFNLEHCLNAHPIKRKQWQETAQKIEIEYEIEGNIEPRE